MQIRQKMTNPCHIVEYTLRLPDNVLMNLGHLENPQLCIPSDPCVWRER
jgi:hypothetical protein